MRFGSDAVDGSSTGTSVPWIWGLLGLHDSEERAMTITTIGLDIAKRDVDRQQNQCQERAALAHIRRMATDLISRPDMRAVAIICQFLCRGQATVMTGLPHPRRSGWRV